MLISESLAWLFILPIAIACVSWTVTHEEVFREPREYCLRRCADSKIFLIRKFFYLFTCEYCFSHYVTIFFLWLTNINCWNKLILMISAQWVNQQQNNSSFAWRNLRLHVSVSSRIVRLSTSDLHQFVYSIGKITILPFNIPFIRVFNA